MTTEIHTIRIPEALLILEIAPANWTPEVGHPMRLRRAVLTVAALPEGRNPFSDIADYSGTITAKYERDYGFKWKSDDILVDLAEMAGLLFDTGDQS